MTINPESPLLSTNNVITTALLSLALATSLQVAQPTTLSAGNGCFLSGGGYCTDSYCTLNGGYCYVGIGSPICDCLYL